MASDRIGEKTEGTDERRTCLLKRRTVAIVGENGVVGKKRERLGEGGLGGAHPTPR